MQERDRYGWLLTYAYVDGTFVNRGEVLRSVYALPYTALPNVKPCRGVPTGPGGGRGRRGIWSPVGGLKEPPQEFRPDDGGATWGPLIYAGSGLEEGSAVNGFNDP